MLMYADVEYRESQEETQAKDCRCHRKLLKMIDYRILYLTFNCQRNNWVSFISGVGGRGDLSTSALSFLSCKLRGFQGFRNAIGTRDYCAGGSLINLGHLWAIGSPILQIWRAFWWLEGRIILMFSHG